MNALELIQDLRKKGVDLRAEGPEIVCVARPGTMTAEMRKHLRENKNEILRVLRDTSDAAEFRRKGTPSIPLSSSQIGLWYLDQVEGGRSTTYNSTHYFQIEGQLDAVAFTKSLDTIFNRHSSLRTTFKSSGGEPFQVIGSPGPFPLRKIDLRSLEENKAEVELDRIKSENRTAPFDLHNGPCVRGILVRLADLNHYFILTEHHIVSDGWSSGVFRRELSILYNAFIANKESPLPSLPLQYSDYATRQRATNRSEAYQDSLRYWLKRLESAPAALNLKTDRPRPPVQSFNGATIEFEINQTLHQRLQDISRENRVTLFMTLLTGFKIMLRQKSGQEDIVVGIVSANRQQSEYEKLIGFFATTLALRTDLSGDSTPREILKRIRTGVFEAQEHQIVSFEQLVAALDVKRDARFSPVFQVMFVFQNTPVSTMDMKGLTIHQELGGKTAAMFDILVSMSSVDERLTGRIQFNVDLFDEKTIRGTIDDFETCLQCVIDEPEKPLFPV